ncbi:MAG: hypothetical protein IPO89_11700 [Actinomycetales bacterium]|nr:hypothetical protein [Candidatus Lutibacillus vidarii]
MSAQGVQKHRRTPADPRAEMPPQRRMPPTPSRGWAAYALVVREVR